MQLEKLAINDVRNLTDLYLDCNSSTNVITGKNAAGKTAILESIYLLSRAASFRTPKLKDVIQHGKQGFTVSARLNINDTGHNAGIEKTPIGTQLRFNGQKVNRRSEQAQNIPLITYTAETSRLLYDMPKERRHWLDWTMFHVEPDYMDKWRSYHYALRQRNSLLRADVRKDELYQPWEKTMADTSHWLNESRSKYLAQLNRETGRNLREVLGKSTIELSEKQGSAEHIREQLEQHRNRDRKVGHTGDGPHRHDIYFRVNEYPAGKTLSRGEGKQFLLFMVIAQARVFASRLKHRPIVLVDDLPAELDPSACSLMFKLLAQEKGQIFITAINEDSLTGGSTTCKRFHVEHGKLVKLVE